MNKAKLNYIVDLCLFISFFIASITGILLFLGIKGRYGVASMHDWSGIIMIVLGVVHLFLHRRWIFSMTKNIFKK